MTKDENKRLFLAVHDYGMGGVWFAIRARTSDEIESLLPEFAALEERPEWMDDETYDLILADGIYDIDEPPTAIIRQMMKALDENAPGAERFRIECHVGARVTGTVDQHEVFGFFVDCGWHVRCLMMPGCIPEGWRGPDDFPPIGTQVRGEVLNTGVDRVNRQVILRFVGFPEADDEGG